MTKDELSRTVQTSCLNCLLMLPMTFQIVIYTCMRKKILKYWILTN